ncbi:hypothetical protein K435DRAFT_789433 [Dendrothele bispora CBS 962.96]|uniref:Uncharacterized protein n=1 Tax=Dendrothele bispora (strain CBS 962.96) TaxID=1314807 RepID=A0A4S8MU39_DENBC|nr:hypothetical protein K435DRAFT_789433 [Dendrothele bispora CBS 962.96]
MNNPSGNPPPHITPQYLAAVMAFLQQNGQFSVSSNSELSTVNASTPGIQSVAAPVPSPTFTPAPASNEVIQQNVIPASANSTISLPSSNGFANFSVEYANNRPNSSGPSAVAPASQQTWLSNPPNRIQPYVSPNVASQGHPSISAVAESQAAASASRAPVVAGAAPASFSGMQSLGFQSLGSQVNQQRLSHAQGGEGDLLSNHRQLHLEIPTGVSVAQVPVSHGYFTDTGLWSGIFNDICGYPQISVAPKVKE